MRRSMLLVSVILFVPLYGMAQDIPKLEVFGGYSYIRDSDLNYHGWNFAIAGNVNRWFSIVGDVSGHYNAMKNKWE